MTKGKHWKKFELDLMFEVIEEVLPRLHKDWTCVASLYNQKPMAERDLDQIRNKFKALRNTKRPTGNTDISEDVLAAKRLHRMIKEKCSAVLGEDGISENEQDRNEAFRNANEGDMMNYGTNGEINVSENYDEDTEVAEKTLEETNIVQENLPVLPGSSNSARKSNRLIVPSPCSTIASSLGLQPSVKTKALLGEPYQFKTMQMTGAHEEDWIEMGKSGFPNIPLNEKSRKRRKLNNTLDFFQDGINDSLWERRRIGAVRREEDKQRDEKRKYEERREQERRMYEEEREYERRMYEERREYERRMYEEEREYERRMYEEEREYERRRYEEERQRREDERRWLFEREQSRQDMLLLFFILAKSSMLRPCH